MATYTYNELNTQCREIRLCTLLPGSFDEPVACSISVVSLDDKPQYESLSYVWGPPIFNKRLIVRGSIECEQQPCSCDDRTAVGSACAPDYILRVTTSLYTAFRYLRKTDQTRVVRPLLHRQSSRSTFIVFEHDFHDLVVVPTSTLSTSSMHLLHNEN